MLFKISKFVSINVVILLYFSFVGFHLQDALFHGLHPINLFYSRCQYYKTTH